MRATRCWVLAIIMGSSTFVGMRVATAADIEGSITTVPMRYIVVDGDSGKFRAHHWMNDGYAGGIKDASGRFTLPDGTEVSGEGHALIDANDLGAALSIKKERVGFFDFDYSEFRKYFDTGAGAHRRFATLQSPDTDKDLHLDIGKFGFETGLTFEGWPELALAYEREFKNGTKSRLTWVAAKEAGETRYIGPSWQEIDETVDSFALKANDEIAGITLHGEQRWEFVRVETLREEKLQATTDVASDTKIRRQDQAPQANLATTTLGAERSFLQDKVFVSTGYHLVHMDNREMETIIESNAAGVPTNFSNPKQKRDARADNNYDTHTWVGNVNTQLFETLNVTTKMKAEVIRRRSNSTYPADGSPSSSGGSTPDGVIDENDQSLADSKVVRWGEGVGLRFTQIPRTALYTELELEQARLLLREDRKDTVGGNASELFNRETVTLARRGTWTLGGRTDPWPFLDLTAQVRRRINNIDYDDQRETVASGTALSAFFDAQNIHTNEFSTRATFKPCRWFRPSFRYQFRDDKYDMRFEAQQAVKAGTVSHIYTFDVTAQPLRELTTTASFSRQTAVTATPARLASSANIPAFHADVNTWLFGVDYVPKPNVSVTSTLQLSSANNFNDFSNTGKPYGADFQKLDLTTGIKWSPAKAPNTTVGAEYDLYTYNPNENVEAGEYAAHVLWFEVSQKF